MATDDKVIRVVCAIIRDDLGRVLAAKRSLGRTLQAKWEFPGGKINDSELPEEALIRELFEELAVRISVLGLFSEVDFQYDFGAVHLMSYMAVITAGVPVLMEHEEIRWLDPMSLKTVEWAPADLPIVRELEQALSENNFGTSIRQ